MKFHTLIFAIAVCLITSPANCQEWTFDARSGAAYAAALNLQTDVVHRSIPHPETTPEHYVTGLAEAIELIFTEDREKFSIYEERFENRIDRDVKADDPNDLFLRADLYLQWAFVYLKFGHEFDAALSIKHAYNTVQDIRKKYPEYKTVQKTAGVLNVIIGSVPEKYNWVLNLANMSGNVQTGLEELRALANTNHLFAGEAKLLYCFTTGFVLQQPTNALGVLEHALEKDAPNRLELFLGAALQIKNSNSEKALHYLDDLEHDQPGLPLYYADYLKGEIFLHKGEYESAVASYQAFITSYPGENHIKDAHYKTGLTYWLDGNKEKAQASFDNARTAGRDATEADRYAAKSLNENEWPHVALTKARFYTDGGYYDHARKILASLTARDLPTRRDRAEYQYRNARVYHRMMELKTAKEYYAKTIEITGGHEWYFAPNACLQLGYIAVAENDLPAARNYFKQALGYKRHAYKNSIDSKARTALAHLTDRK